MSPAASLLALEDVDVVFRPGGLLTSFDRSAVPVRAVQGASLQLGSHETVGVVGESGSGKSTLGRAAIGLQQTTAGVIRFRTELLPSLLKRHFRDTRRRMQIVVQNPYGSLTPWLTIGSAIGEVLTYHGLTRTGPETSRRISELLVMVGLKPEHQDRYPREFSGGQRQRLAIARALALEPDLLVCDEVTSALDVSVRAQIVNLLVDLGSERQLAYLFITHDLHVARVISDRIAVMYAGRIVETGVAETVFREPAHPYTQHLLAALPTLEGHYQARPATNVTQVGQQPDVGCPFAARCPSRLPRCLEAYPATTTVGPGHEVDCHLYEGSGA